VFSKAIEKSVKKSPTRPGISAYVVELIERVKAHYASVRADGKAPPGVIFQHCATGICFLNIDEIKSLKKLRDSTI